MVLRGIEDMQRGAPNCERMGEQLAANIRRQMPQLQPMFKALGAVEVDLLRGVGPGGYDIYGEVRQRHRGVPAVAGANGKAEDVLFRPDGNDELGAVVSCSEEAALKSGGDAAPISLFLYNSSGKEIQVYKLDANGKRRGPTAPSARRCHRRF